MLGEGFDDDSVVQARHERAFELLDRLIDMSIEDSGREGAERELREGRDGERLVEMQAAFDAHPDSDAAPDLKAAVMARLSAEPGSAPAAPQTGATSRLRAWLGLDMPAGRAAGAPRALAAAAVVILVVVAVLMAGDRIAPGGGVSGAALTHSAIDPRLIAVAVGAVVAFVAYLRLRDR